MLICGVSAMFVSSFMYQPTVKKPNNLVANNVAINSPAGRQALSALADIIECLEEANTEKLYSYLDYSLSIETGCTETKLKEHTFYKRDNLIEQIDTYKHFHPLCWTEFTTLVKNNLTKQAIIMKITDGIISIKSNKADLTAKKVHSWEVIFIRRDVNISLIKIQPYGSS